MALIVLGINHDTATVDVREKVSFSPEEVSGALHSLCGVAGISEAVILSTCNRTEILAAGQAIDPDEILHWLGSFHRLQKDALQSSIYCHTDQDAVRHMIRVASGMDSMILGEPQIFGQMKSAYAVAQEAGTVFGPLHHAFQHAFAYAKKIRSQTAIGQNPVSVAFAAVHLAQRIFGELSGSVALLIGAGATIDLVARYLVEKKVGKLIVANRTFTRAEELAGQYHAEVILLPDIPARLAEADIVISSTASQLPILGKGAVEQAIRKRKRRPIFMVDIAVPRDIEPEVAELSDVYLYTVDDLRDIIDENRKARQEEVVKADRILEEGVGEYCNLQRESDVVHLVRAFREQSEKVRDAELHKALRQLQSGADPEKVLENLARLLTNKLIHAPSLRIRQAAAEGNCQSLAELVKIYGLDGSNLEEKTE